MKQFLILSVCLMSVALSGCGDKAVNTSTSTKKTTETNPDGTTTTKTDKTTTEKKVEVK